MTDTYTTHTLFAAPVGRLNAANSRGTDLMRLQDEDVQTFREDGVIAHKPPANRDYAIIAHYMSDDEHDQWAELADDIDGLMRVLREWTGSRWQVVQSYADALDDLGLEVVTDE